MASRRLNEMRDETARRRTARGQQRSEIMAQRRQGAQTAYMDRAGQRALAGGATGNAAGAISYGESRGEYADRSQGYANAGSLRQLQRDTGAGLVAQGQGALLEGQGARDTGAAAYLSAENQPSLMELQNKGLLDVADRNYAATTESAKSGALASQYNYGSEQLRLNDQRQKDRDQRLFELQLQQQQPLSGEQLEQTKPFKTSEGGWFSDPEWGQMDTQGRIKKVDFSGDSAPETDITDEEADSVAAAARKYNVNRVW
ncbi:hypothetical protein N9878_01275 [bacterium]|nr:hypothetical protein [bacterium]